MKMRIAIGADHGGVVLKEWLAAKLREHYDVIDAGAHTFESEDDYPDYAAAVARKVAAGEADRGILICGSGVGAAVAANKIRGARACLCHDTYSAHQGVEHDDMNVISLGARVVGEEMALELATAFLQARFSGDARFRRRLQKIAEIEKSGG